MGIAAEYRRRSKKQHVGVWVAIGIAAVFGAALLLGVAILDQRAPEPFKPIPPRLIVFSEDPVQRSRIESQRALARLGIVRIQADAIVILYGSDTYTVMGTCLVNDETAIYQTMHRIRKQRISLVSVKINGQNVSMETLRE